MKGSVEVLSVGWKYAIYFASLVLYALSLMLSQEVKESPLDYTDIFSEAVLLIQPAIWLFYANRFVRSCLPNYLFALGLLVFSLAGVSDVLDEFFEFDDRLDWVENSGYPLGLFLVSLSLVIDGRAQKSYAKLLEQREAAAREESFTDALTNLRNRRFFDQHLKDLLRNPYMNDGRIAMAFLDLDNFKSLNDTFGHQEGDLALRQLAQIISSNIRENDIAFRYGGDEFIILLHGTEPNASATIVDRIRTSFAEFCRPKSQALRRKISLSAGITQVCLRDSFSSVVERADRGMYQAKNAGKDRVAQL